MGNNMFAYCNNNPVKFVDAKGTMPLHDNPLLQAIEDFINWYHESDENECDSSGTLSLNAKAKRTVQSIERNTVATVGVGLGMYGGLIATDYASVDVGMHYDLARVELSGGKLDVYQYYYEGIEASLLFATGGESREMRRDISGVGSWKIMDSPDALPVFGVGGYAVGGATIAIGFDLNSFLSDIDDIWR